jgi:hypothetical protein
LRAAQDQWQARDLVFQDVVGEALFYAIDGSFIAKRASEEDQRDVGTCLLEQRKSVHAVPTRKAISGDNHIERLLPKFSLEIFARVNGLSMKIEARLFKGANAQVHVPWIVLDNEQSKRLC